MDYLSNMIKEKKTKKDKKTKKKNFNYDNIPVNVGLPPQLTHTPQNINVVTSDITSNNENPNYKMPSITASKNNSEIQIQINTNNNNSNKPLPQYGCLKNGKMPTYKNWKKRQSNNLDNYKPPSIQFTDSNVEKDNNNKQEEPVTYRKKRLEEIKEKMQRNILESKNESLKKTQDIINDESSNQNINSSENVNDSQNINSSENVNDGQNINSDKNKNKKNFKNKTLKKKLKVGKISDSHIAVLIKNNKTRKLNEIEKKEIEKTKLSDMKDELKKVGLLKAGSSAPPDVIREIYTSSKLTGDVENTNNKTMLDTFLSQEK